MNPSQLRKYSRIVVVLAILFLPRQCPAQAEEHDEYVGKQFAAWNVNIDRTGKATTSFWLSSRKNGTDLTGARAEIVAALRDALQCTLADDKPGPEEYGVQISSQCNMPVMQEGLVIRSMINPGPVRKALGRYGDFTVNLTIALPKLGFSNVGMKSRSFSYDAWTSHNLTFKPEDRNTGDLPLEFGYHRSYVIALITTGAILLVAPVVLILVIRRRSLQLAGKDATAAWFGYWRVHRWIAEGIWVAWIIAFSVFSVETFVAFLAGQSQPFADALLLFVPPGIVSFLCQYLARPLWLEVRGVAWNRREMLVKGFWEHAAAILPLVFIIIGIGSIGRHTGTSLLWFAAAVVMKLFGTWMHGKISKAIPRPLHSGDLREKVIETAHRAGVKIQQVFLMPSKRLQMGNAFAMQGGRVMITDYLLERLTKRETDCVMAHEIGHVKMRHAVLLSWISILVLFVVFNVALWGAVTILPSFLMNAAQAGSEAFLAFQGWFNEYLHFPLAFLFAVLVRYFLSRRFERSADEFATLVTGDPESMIRALVKLSKMNLMLISWGNWDERLSTHPSTLRRAKAIAYRHRIDDERVRQLLETPASRDESEGYAVPDEAASADIVYTTEFRTQKALVITLLVMLTLSTAPLLWGRFVRSSGLPPSALWAGLVLMPLVLLAVVNYASLLGYGKMKKGMRQKASRAGFVPGDGPCWFVGLSPEEHPRIYEGHTVWDIGFLKATANCLIYRGDRVGFRIPRDRVTSVSKGVSFPTWFGIAETYLRWTENGQERVVHFHSIDGRSMTAIAKRSKSLLLDLASWKDGRLPAGEGTAAEDALGPPVLPDVKGIHPRQALTAKAFCTSLVFVALLIFGISGLFSLDSSLSWYGFGLGSWSLLFANMPAMRYKEMP